MNIFAQELWLRLNDSLNILLIRNHWQDLVNVLQKLSKGESQPILLQKVSNANSRLFVSFSAKLPFYGFKLPHDLKQPRSH